MTAGWRASCFKCREGTSAHNGYVLGKKKSLHTQGPFCLRIGYCCHIQEYGLKLFVSALSTVLESIFSISRDRAQVAIGDMRAS